jgi:hypothetical protein
MQTFLPFPNFPCSASVLDWRRLGKQRIEARHIAEVVLGLKPKSRYRNHAAVRMWRGFGYFLCSYGIAVCLEWRGRGYRDQQLEAFERLQKLAERDDQHGTPPWFGDEAFHSAHRAALLAKAPEWYAQFGWKEIPLVDYVWPAV